MNNVSAEMEQRQAGFEAQRAELLAAGYSEHQRIISITQANIYALLTAVPLAVLCIWIFSSRWGGGLAFSLSGTALFLLGVIISIPAHELLHGLAWGLCCKDGFKSIRFGFMRQYLAPYCHCREPLRFSAYMLGGLMPLLVLGFGLFAVALQLGNVPLMGISVFNIISAGGDTTIACLLLRHSRAVILDHPSECGFVAYQITEAK